VQDLFDADGLRAKVVGALNQKNQILVKLYNRRAVDADTVVAELLSYGERLRPMVADTSLLLERMLDEARRSSSRPARRTLLDVDHGTYPFVTSSNATAGGACTGSGIPPTRISGVIAIAKAYTTSGRRGPVPTELLDDHGRAVCVRWGPSTGRHGTAAALRLVRRGYLPLPARVNGVTDFVLTKLDVLTGWPRFPRLRRLRRRWGCAPEMPMTGSASSPRAVPVYETFAGWSEDIRARPR